MANSIVLIVYMLIASLTGRHFVVLAPRWDLQPVASANDAPAVEASHREGQMCTIYAHPRECTASGPPVLDSKVFAWIFERGCFPWLMATCMLVTFCLRELPYPVVDFLHMPRPPKFVPHCSGWTSAILVWMGNTCLMNRQNCTMVWWCFQSGRAQLLVTFHVACSVAVMYSFHSAYEFTSADRFSLFPCEMVYRSGLAYAWATVDALQVGRRDKIVVITSGVVYNAMQYIVLAFVDERKLWDEHTTEWWAYAVYPRNIVMTCYANAGLVLLFMLGSLLLGRPFSLLHGRWTMAVPTFSDYG